jgi:iron complex outermembrane receptor protein
MMHRSHLASGLLAGVSALAFGPLAYAQAAAGAEPQALDEVVITGSRVIQNGNAMPTPVTVVSAEQLLKTTPTNVIDALTAMPVFAGGRTTTSQPGNSSQNNAAHVLNLRNIGNTRTLILFDGRRVPPTSPAGEVNVDLVPSMLLSRVDVVTGGASAVYGSDAVAGVVNFVTDRNFNGFKVDAHYGTSQLNDGQEWKFGIAGGTPLFDGRGHIEGSYEFYDNEGIFNKFNRGWGRNVWTMQGAGTTANPYHLVRNSRISQSSFLGLIRSGPLADQVFRLNGQLSPFQHGAPSGANGIESGGDGGYFYQASLQALLRSHQAFGRFDFDLTDKIHAYAEVVGMRTHNANNHQTNEFRNITLSAQNAFLAPEHQQRMAAANVTQFTYSKMMMQAPPLGSDTRVKDYLINVGLEGEFGDGWKWDLSYVHSENEQRTANPANIDNQRAQAALDAVRDGAGNIVCRTSITHPGLYPGCIPLNLFGPTSESIDALNYILVRTQYVAETSMDDVGASIAGSPFDTWAGPVQMAFSAEMRKLRYSSESNAQPTDRANCTGLRFNCNANTPRWISNVVATTPEVSQTVKEAAIEADVPLLKDAPFAESFNINGAARVTDYNTSGTVWTWKLGFSWDVNGQVRLRGTRSRDIRAPNLNELFGPVSVNPAGVTDVHTGIVGQAPFVQSSNPGLVPEVAETWTAGFIYRPEWLPNFSASLDWYKIKIGNAITTLQGQNVTIQNICESSGGTSPFCDLIQRPLPFSDRSAANFVTAFLSRPENAQTVKTEGFDAEVNYSADLLGGNLGLRGLLTYQPHLKTVQFPGAPVLDAADVPPLAKTRVTILAKYRYDKWSIDIQERWRSGYTFNPDRRLVYSEPRRKSYALTNLTVTYEPKKGSEFYANVTNLFDKQPDPFGAVGGPSGVPGLFGGYPQGDDIVGRYFVVGVRLRR